MGFFLFDSSAREDRVPNRTLLSYSVGLTGQNISYGFVSNWLNYFCINVLHIPAGKIGKVFFASYFWDAVNDPVIGAAVDKRRHKNGEKLRPYLLKLPPIIGVLALLMFMRLPLGDTGKLVWLLSIYFLWDFFYSVQDVALWGMVSMSSPLSAERSRVAQWASIGAGAGGAVVMCFQLLRGIMNSAGLSDLAVFSIFAVLFALGGELISMRAHRMRENIVSESPKESFFKAISVLKYNRTLIFVVVARLLSAISPKPGNAYFFENLVSFDIGSLHLDGKTCDFLFGLFGGLPGAVGIFFATKLADRLGGMKRMLVLGYVVDIAVRAAAFFIGYRTLPRMLAVALMLAVSNIPLYMKDVAHRSLLSDSVDFVEWKTGMRTEGISFSMQNFVSKMQSGISKLLEGEILSFLGYDSRRKERGLPQSDRFLRAQWPMYILAPILGNVLYLIAISFVKDDRARRDEIERELRERRAAAEKKLAEAEEPAPANTVK